MPSLPNTLERISERHRANGAQFGNHSLEVISAAMGFLEAIGNPLADDTAIAAYAASQLMPDDAKKLLNDSGISTDLLPKLDLNAPVGIAHQLCHVLARGNNQQAVVAATVLFTLCRKAARRGSAARMSELSTMADMATRTGSQNPDLAQKLSDEMAKITAIAPPPQIPSECLISISIDLVGSTDAKTRIMKLAQGDENKIDKLNEQIYREFCRIERKLYETSTHHSGPAKPIDPAKFFTVKGIGDEIWILCSITEQEVSEIGHAIIDACLEVATQSVLFFATENDDDRNFEPNFDYGKTESIKSPIKIFADLIRHASSIGRIRDEYLISDIPTYLKNYHRRTPAQSEIAEVSKRLCLSGYEPMGWSILNEFRTDFIGHEIDRFFRTTKAAIPGTVTIGESLAKGMGLTFVPYKEGISAVMHTDNPLRGGHPLDALYACTRSFQPQDLKGIGYQYDTYTLFGPRAINGLYVQMRADKDNGFPVMPYGDTESLISPDVVKELVKSIVKSERK